MSKGNIANLKFWPKGVTGNPGGRNPVLPPEIRSERKKNQVGLIRLVGELLTMTQDALKERLEGSDCTQLVLATQGLIIKAKEGDVNAFKYLMEVMVGKIPEHDYDGFTEEDLRILNRVKEVKAEYDAKQPAPALPGSGH